MPIPSDAEILDLLNKLDRVPADELESDWLDFKPWKSAKEDLKEDLKVAIEYRQKYTGIAVAEVRDHRKAAVFEIGCLKRIDC